MQQLSKAILAAANDLSPAGREATREVSPVPGADDLIDAACAWSAACLREMRGETLRKGMAISQAISDFVNEMETNAAKPL